MIYFLSFSITLHVLIAVFLMKIREQLIIKCRQMCFFVVFRGEPGEEFEFHQFVLFYEDLE